MKDVLGIDAGEGPVDSDTLAVDDSTRGSPTGVAVGWRCAWIRDTVCAVLSPSVNDSGSVFLHTQVSAKPPPIAIYLCGHSTSLSDWDFGEDVESVFPLSVHVTTDLAIGS